MKKVIFFILFLLPNLSFAQSRNAWDVSFNRLFDSRKEYTPKADSVYKKVPSSGYSFGVSLYTHQEGDLVSMKYGLRWNVQKGVATFVTSNFTGNPQKITTDYKINFFEVPVLVHYATKKNTGYIELGVSPYLYLNSRAETTNWGEFFFGQSLRDLGFIERQIRVYAVCNLGYSFELTPKLSLFFQGESQFRKISALLPTATTNPFFSSNKPFGEGKALETRLGLTLGFKKSIK